VNRLLGGGKKIGFAPGKANRYVENPTDCEW
jgi:hypothetical protein